MQMHEQFASVGYWTWYIIFNFKINNILPSSPRFYCSFRGVRSCELCISVWAVSLCPLIFWHAGGITFNWLSSKHLCNEFTCDDPIWACTKIFSMHHGAAQATSSVWTVVNRVQTRELCGGLIGSVSAWHISAGSNQCHEPISNN